MYLQNKFSTKVSINSKWLMQQAFAGLGVSFVTKFDGEN
jgi:hypothetical protein